MEAFMYGGKRILIHVARCFSLFLKFGFIPKSLSTATLVSIVKHKGGNLCDANNYLAIAIYTAIS